MPPRWRRCFARRRWPPTRQSFRAPDKFLFWTPKQQVVGYRNIEKIFPTRLIKRGPKVMALPKAKTPLAIDYQYQGAHWNTDSFMQANRISGLLVIRDGKIVLERYGLGETAHDRWTSFSVGKSVTSTLVGAAIADGYIKSVDDPVTDYLPELKGSAYDGVTLRQLLTMSSGVKWNEDYEDPKSDVNQFALGTLAPEATKDPIVAYMAKLPREAEPGTKFEYKTGESELIGVLVARATKQHLADYLSKKIWAPLGMQRNGVWIIDKSGMEQGGCCISMTLRDYGRFGLFMLDGGRAGGKSVLPPGWVKDATTTQIQSDWDGYGYGFQWWVRPGGDGYEAIGIFGQSIMIDPKEKLVIVTNSAWPEADAERYYRSRNAYVAAVISALKTKR